MRIWLIICGFFLLIALPVRAENLVVGLPEPGRVPFFWHDEVKGFQGTYVDLLTRVSARAGFTVEYRMVPQARLIAEFNAGKIDIEPGIAPSWRPSASENAISRYTTPFMNMGDVLVVPRGKAAPDIASTSDLVKLNGLRVGQVRGFFVPPGLGVIECVDEYTIAQKVHAGHLDVGLMNAEVAKWYKSRHHLTFEISAPYASTPVAFRLHSRQEKWVEPINRILSQLKRSGELQRIMSRKRK